MREIPEERDRAETLRLKLPAHLSVETFVETRGAIRRLLADHLAGARQAQAALHQLDRQATRAGIRARGRRPLEGLSTTREEA